MMDFLRCRTEGKKDFCNLVEGTKLIINEQDVAVKKAKELNIPGKTVWKKKKELEEAIKETIPNYKEIIFR